MMTIDVESSSRREWVKKLKLIILVKNSKDMSLELQVDLIKMVSLWNKVSSVTTELNFSSHLEPVDIEPKEMDKEKENPSEDALSAPISKLFL